jgi:hypothetical protein
VLLGLFLPVDIVGSQGDDYRTAKEKLAWREVGAARATI